MKGADSKTSVVRLMALLAAAMLAGGCAEELGPVPMPVARVQGVVKDGERPVSGGWIEFLPVDGTIGNLRSARLRPDGKFDADGVPVGRVAIRLVNLPVKMTAYVRMFAPFTSPIRRVIPPHPAAPLNIDLVEETARYLRSHGQGLPAAPPPADEEP